MGEHQGRTLGDFLVAEKIGEGGFGAVYRAHQPLLDRAAVIKLLHTQHRATAAATERFLREARLASRLDHPYAAHIYAFGAESDGTLWIAMELVRGTTLSEYLRAHGPLPLERLVPLLERVCEVVHSAHEQGIIHRDLKPANVMVMSRAGRLLPKLLDFGIAKSVVDSPEIEKQELAETIEMPPTRLGTEDTITPESAPPEATALIDKPGSSTPRLVSLGAKLTQRGAVMGSPQYMAPEQWTDATTVTSRTDLYAIGILAYEALTGAPPFRGKTMPVLAAAHAHDPVPPVPSPLPRALDAVFARALAKRAEDRFKNALEMAAAFRAAAGLTDEKRAVPQLEPAISEQYLVHAPQPIAEAIAALEAARDVRQARDAFWVIPSVLVRWIGVLALLARSRLSTATATARELAAVRTFGTTTPADDDWLELTHALVRGHAGNPDLHPIPELVLFACEGTDDQPSAGMRAYHELVALRSGLTDPSATEDAIFERLRPALDQLAQLLRHCAFVCSYALVLPRGRMLGERWVGTSRAQRTQMDIRGGVLDDRPILVDGDGGPVLALHPLVQIVEPAPGVPAEVFLYAGRAQRGAKLIAPPSSFERHDPQVLDWLRLQLPTTLDDAAAGADVEKPPYRGLAAFTADEAALYFGREQMVDTCVNRLRVQPLVTIVGPSGAGKSSFVQAGVIPALGNWRAIITRPGPAPLVALGSRMAAAGIDAPDLSSRVLADPSVLGELLRDDAATRGPVVLVIDQLEELFTLGRDESVRRAFASALAFAARAPEDSVRVVMTLRDDFLIQAQALPGLRDRLAHGLQLLTTPGREDLERILVEPAKRVGYEFEDVELPARMVSEVEHRPGALALLSFTASRLWEHRDRHFRRLPTKAYEQLGGVGGALARHAESLLESAPPHEQRLIREAFRHLVTAEGTRAVLTRSELVTVIGDEDVATAIIERLVGSRLLVAYEGHDDEHIELAHEALIEAWPRLVQWRREDQEGARLRDQLRAAARQWDARGRPKGLLWRDDVLVEYKLWRSRFPGALTDVENAFGRASLAEAARGRFIRRALLASLFALLTMGLMVLYALNRSAEEARGQADSSAAEAHRRLLELHVEQGRQALLARDSMRALAYFSKAYSAGASGPDLRFMIARASADLDTQVAVLPHSTAQIFDVALTPDDSTIATAADDGARVWDGKTGQERFKLAHSDRVWTVAFSPDKTRLVTSSRDGTAKIWDATSGTLVHALAHPAEVRIARFSPGGRLIATGSRDNIVRVWESATGRLLASLAGHTMLPHDLSFHTDNIRLVSASIDGTARVWNVSTGKLIALLAGHEHWVRSARFSPDGSLVATASHDRSAKLWDAATGELKSTWRHVYPVRSVDFSPDGRRAVTASDDPRSTVWDVASGEPVLSLIGHTDIIPSARFSPDGTRILTASRDRTARLWDAATGSVALTFVGHAEGILVAGFGSADRVITGSSDRTVRVWNARTTRMVASTRAELSDAMPLASSARLMFAGAPGVRLGINGRLLAASDQGRPTIRSAEDGAVVRRFDATSAGAGRGVWSPDGERVATLEPGGARLWVPMDNNSSVLLEGTQSASLVEFAGDGKLLAIVYRDRPTELWDVASRARVTVLVGGERTSAVAFSPNGTKVATAHADGTAKLWNTKTGSLLLTLIGHEQELNHISWSADGTRVATAGQDKTARIWNANEGRPLAVLQGHTGPVNSVAFHPEGGLLVTSSDDETAKVWNARAGSALFSYSFLASVGWAAFSVDGRRLITLTLDETRNSPPTFQFWDVEMDRRSPAELEAYVRCRVPLAFENERLVPVSAPTCP